MISIELVMAIAAYAFVTCATPGPNNILLTGFGANFGFVKTLPAVFGIVAGGASINIGVGLGLGALLQEYGFVKELLKVAGSLYLAFLSWKLLNTNPGGAGVADSDGEPKPFSFFEAFSFQYVNPKVWLMLTTANVSFAVMGPDYWMSVIMITLTFMVVGTPSIMLWAGFGQLVSRLLGRPAYRRIFNACMASMTILCVVYIWSV